MSEATLSVQLPTAAAIEELSRKLDLLLSQQQHAPLVQLDQIFNRLVKDSDGLGFEPMRVYSAKQVAYFLGLKSEKSVYAIPENELPKVRRIGTHIGYHGINVLAYMLRKDPVDIEGAFDLYREKLIQERPTVKPIPSRTTGLTRIH